MARDPRKNSAYDSGMRGREKPKIADSHGRNAVNDNAGGEDKQAAGKTVGDPGGIDHTNSAYSSGMRGMERPKQKSAEGGANEGVRGSAAPGNKQAKDTHVGEPDGHNDAGEGARHGVGESHMRNAGEDAYELGNNGNAANATEQAAEGAHPYDEAGILGEEDDTHINVRVPKASIRKKIGGLPS